MRFSLFSLVRLIGFMALCSSALAIGVSRVNPHFNGERTPAPSRYIGLNGVFFYPPQTRDMLLDTETGKTLKAKLGTTFSVDFACSAPWRQKGGSVPVVGRMISSSGMARERLCEGSGLGVFDFETGELLTELNIEQGPVISGRPCWIPGITDRIIYPAGDGNLYVRDLYQDNGQGCDGPFANNRTNPSRSAQPLVWQCERPAEGAFILGDPIIPINPEFGGRMIVTLTPTRSPGKKLGYHPSELWTLKFERETLAILEATRLTEPEAENEMVDERLANLTVSSEGQPVIAFLKRTKGEQPWGLKFATVSIDANTGRLSTKRADEIGLSKDHAVTLPCFSPDGRWIFAISRCSEPSASITKIGLNETLATSYGTRGRLLSARDPSNRSIR